MTTSVRRKIPVLICASCLTTGLLASTGATTAMAASQSPTAVAAGAPADDGDWGGGGGRDGGGGWPGDRDPGGGGGWPGARDPGGGGHHDDGWPQKPHDGDHGWPRPDDWPKKPHDGDHGWPRPDDWPKKPHTQPDDWPKKPHDGDHGWPRPDDWPKKPHVEHPEHPKDQPVEPPVEPPKDQPVMKSGDDQLACEKSGGIWADGYCGKFNKLDVPPSKPSPEQDKLIQKAETLVECGKFATGFVLGPLGVVIKTVSQGSAIVEDLKTHHEERVWTEVVPGAKCLIHVWNFEN
ncbi:hypothetical protein ACFVXE_32390 [Streptomyces sp. NPDC058231]|uniref:hypothetical protein n=1 Tax=Streptomyces sp. NPDC058231 TaxID=3346392 RepID=UPI0036E0F2C1